jgi:hypothetical protein
MSEVSDYFPGNLNAVLSGLMAWLLGQMTSNQSQFGGKAAPTPTSAEFIEGAIEALGESFDGLAQTIVENIVLWPLSSTAALDQTKGADGFPINYSPALLTSGNLLVNLIDLSAATTISGRVLNMSPSKQPTDYRVDVYATTDQLYYKGSATPAADGTWSLAGVAGGTVIAFLMPATSPQPAGGSWTASVSGWIAHSNMGVGATLADYFVRVYTKTDIEYLQEDNVPLIVQDGTHARFGTSRNVPAGTPVAHVIYNDPVYGLLDLYSTLQNNAVLSDLPRGQEVPPSDPDYQSAADLTSASAAAIPNRCWIYDAALAMIAFTLNGLWDMAGRIVTRLEALRAAGGYLPSRVLENAEEGGTANWTLATGAGTIANVFDSSEPPAASGGSQVIQFTATTAPATWNFTGAGFPDAADSILHWHFKTGVDFVFTVGATTSTGKVTTFKFVSAGTDGYDAPSQTITVVVGPGQDLWQWTTGDLGALLAQYVPGETLVSIASFSVTLSATGAINFDDLSVGTPQPAGSLSFSYDVYNGQIDQAYIRSGAVAWVAYAYGIYMERTGDYARAALGLQAMLNFLFSMQSTATDIRQGLVTLGFGKYVNPGYQYIPGQIFSTSVEHNIDCYFACTKAASLLPTAATALLAKGSITPAQYSSLLATATEASSVAATLAANLIRVLYTAPSASAWQATHAYALGDQIQTSGGSQHKCVVAGTSGGTAPTFNGSLGGTTNDGTVTWQKTGLIGDPGHFAQGILSTSALIDVSESVDSNGTWAAMFAHAFGRDDIAVECLKFAYAKFLAQNQTIQLSSAADSYNEAYEQLTPFDGFKFYTDSTGGYSGSPVSVSAEMTWGAIAAYLRLADNADLQTYFAAAYAGGLTAFIQDLISSMATMWVTTGDGMLSCSLAARALPWEFSVRKTVASSAWFWITADRNDILFSAAAADLGKRPYLKIPQGVEQSVNQLDATSSIGALELEVVDARGYASALVSGGKLEGKKLALQVGYPGMNSTDFVTVATQQIDHIEVLEDATGFKVGCRDLKRSAKTKIFLTGDDGLAISDKHQRTLSANPMDVALMILQNELGVGQSDLIAPSAWKVYDPAQGGSTSNPTLVYPNPYLDVDAFLSYRNDIFAGYLFDFTLSQSVEAKQFLENEIFKVLGGYWVTLADGRLSPCFFFPPYALSNLAALDQRTLIGIPRVTRSPIINQVTFRLDYRGSGTGSSGSDFDTELNFAYAPSLEQYDLQGIQIIESKGLRSARGGAALAALTANRIFRRYAGINPVTWKATGGACTYQVTSQFMTLGIEAGDCIFLSHPLLPDFETGQRGIYNRIVEVAEKQPDYANGQMKYKLLDTGWLAAKQLSKVAPTGTQAWLAASAGQQAEYMYLCATATGEYSDGTAGRTVW